MLLQLPRGNLELFKAFERYGNKIRFMSELLPLPETPVTAVNTPVGIFTSMFFKLFSLAPLISIKSFGLRRVSGTSILSSPRKNFAVIDLLLFFTSSTVPAATISPPLTPAYGPTSTR